MASSAFSFGFSGDDIDIDVDQNDHPSSENDLNGRDSSSASASLPKLVEAERHLLHEWTPTLPSQISYNKFSLDVSSSARAGRCSTIRLGRREVFDIRAQLMAEEDDPDHEELIAGLEEGDLKPNFYEGGFKTWECALDLAKVVGSRDEADALGLCGRDGSDEDEDDDNDEGEDVHVIELGCGTAMPSLTIFAQLLARPVPTSPPRRKFYFTLADYNATVLRLVTLPNLLLTWRLNTGNSQVAEVTEEGEGQDEEELDIDPTVLNAFQEDLARRGIVVDFVSGAWSPRFVDLALTTPRVAENNHGDSSRPCKTLLLASETIYSPSSLSAFSETLLELLRRSSIATAPKSKSKSKSKSKALIAAKKVYFGVGGGIDEFLHVLGQQRLREREAVHVEQRVEVKTEGVGRVVLQVELQENAD